MQKSTQNDSPFVTPHYQADPYPFYEQIRTESPVYQTTLPNGTEVYLVTRYADVMSGLKDLRLVKNINNARPDTQHSVATPQNTTMLKADPPEHTRLRTLIHEAFKPKYINQMRSHVQKIADRLIDNVQEQGKLDLMDAFAFPLPVIVICELLGIPAEDDHLFREWSSAFVATGALNQDEPTFGPEMGQMAQYFNKLIEQREKDPRDDFVSDLIHVEQNGDKLSRSELVSMLALLLVAGHETTANLIGTGMLELLKSPHQLEKLKADPSLIKGAVEELLRYVNPLQFVNRYAAEDIEFDAVTIPKGSHVLLVLAAANHDSSYVHSPEELNVAHGDSHHMAFGLGIHFCLGAPLARLEGEIAFATLLRRLPDMRLAISPDDVYWRSTLTLRGLSALPIEY